MKTTVSFCDFCDRFRSYNRDSSFTYVGKRALFDYLESYEEDCGEEIELDVISLCCDYSEFSTALEACQEMASEDEFNLSEEEFDALDSYDQEELEEKALEHLQDNTTVITFQGGVIVQSF
jgi:hypothetical protein